MKNFSSSPGQTPHQTRPDQYTLRLRVRSIVFWTLWPAILERQQLWSSKNDSHPTLEMWSGMLLMGLNFSFVMALRTGGCIARTLVVHPCSTRGVPELKGKKCVFGASWLGASTNHSTSLEVERGAEPQVGFIVLEQLGWNSKCGCQNDSIDSYGQLILESCCSWLEKARCKH